MRGGTLHRKQETGNTNSDPTELLKGKPADTDQAISNETIKRFLVDVDSNKNLKPPRDPGEDQSSGRKNIHLPRQ